MTHPVAALTPLGLWVALGWIAGRYFSFEVLPLARVILFLLAPLTVFTSVTAYALKWDSLLLLPLVLGLCSVVAVAARAVLQRFPALGLAGARELGVATFGIGSSNAGFFGIPVAAALLGEEAVPAAMIAAFGYIFYENTVGYYFQARGRHGSGVALRRVLQLPTLYAFVAALTVQALSGRAFSEAVPLAREIRGVYVFAGMFLLGLGIEGVRLGDLISKPVLTTVLARHTAWPAAAALASALLAAAGLPLSTETRSLLTILALAPIAANTVGIAAETGGSVRLAGAAVLLSSVYSLATLTAWWG